MPIPPFQYNLFVSGAIPNGPNHKTVMGKLVKDVDKEKVKAFIRDTRQRRGRFPELYASVAHGKNLEDLIIQEFDAEINAMHSNIIQAFYPDVVQYHREFQAKHKAANEEIENRSEQRRQNKK